MLTRKVQSTNATIDSIGIPKDPYEAIFEFIWNGFDAQANRIDINFPTTTKLDEEQYIEIVDNGT